MNEVTIKTKAINIEGKDILRLNSMLKKLDYVTIVKEVDKEGVYKCVSLASESALAEEWNSDKDKRYEKYLNK